MFITIMTSSTKSSGQHPQIPFKPIYPPLTRAAVRKLFPASALEVIDPLATIWDEVVHRIVGAIMDLDSNDDPERLLHINLREEMALELGKLTLWLAEEVAKKRLAGRDPSVVDVEQERIECLGPKGAAIIGGTAHLAFEHVWQKRMAERWKPKSKKALEREANPRPTKLAIKPVKTNHFIPRSFIRDYWAVDGRVLRWRRVNEGWASAQRNFGFLIIQILRNPTFIQRLGQGLSPKLAELGYADDPDMLRKAPETLYGNNDLYHRLAHPVMWSRWAIVKASSPLFILPDTFCAHGDFGDGLRLIAPLTPQVCFVTLPTRETEKRIIPLQLYADARLARRISSILIRRAENEFLSHADFRPDEQQTEGASVGSVLKEVEVAIGG
jgi:hypothetical protein